MTIVRHKFLRPSAGGDIPYAPTLQFRPSRARVVDGSPKAVVVPLPFDVVLPGGVLDIDLAPTGLGWCWEIYRPSTGVSWVREYVTVPEPVPDPDNPGEFLPVDYPDLVRVDPKTLEPSATPEPVWWAALEAAKATAADVEAARVDAAGSAVVAGSARDGAVAAAGEASGSASEAVGAASSAVSAAGSAGQGAATATARAGEASAARLGAESAREATVAAAGGSEESAALAAGAAVEAAESAADAKRDAGVVIEMTETGRLSETALNATIGESVEPGGVARPALDDAFVGGVSLNKTGTQADLQAAFDRSSARNTVLYLSGSYILTTELIVPMNLTVVGTGPGLTITQTSPLTPHFSGAGVDSMTVADVTLIGLGTDYVNNDTVYGASAFKFSGNNGRIHLSNVTVKGIAGAGVFVGGGSTRRVIITNSEITGVGLTVLGTSNYSGGVVIQDGVENVTIEETEISEIAQGVGIGHGCERVTLKGNRIHDTSEHGAYLASSDFYTVTGNYFYNTGLLGIKIQKGLAGYTSKSAIISHNHFTDTGSSAIMLTNAIDTTVAISNVTLDVNIITNCGDTGIRIDNARVVKATGNIINGARFGIRLYTSSIVTLTNNDILNIERTGLLIDNTSHIKVIGGTMMNLGILGPEKVGIIVQGVVDHLLLDVVTVDYDISAQNDGLLFGTGTFTNIRIRSGYYRGANWGMRTAAAVSGIIQWRDNIAVGGIGTIDGAPTFIPNLPDGTGQALATVESELNKVKAILRAHKDART